jgi:uncharacterized repeat protein (TIGR03803 family)
MKTNSARSVWGRTLAIVVAALLLVSSAQAANKYKILHHFLNHPASSPEAALVSDAAGNLYGTTDFSEADSCGSFGCGTVFKLTRLSGGKWSYKVIHHFHGQDGQRPTASLIFDAQGNLYGTTYLGGVDGLGTVFELSPSGSGWKEKVLHSFRGSGGDANAPLNALVFDPNGNLYGDTEYGGANGKGAVFELKPSGGKWKESVIYSFTGGDDGTAGDANLVFDSAGNLYGTAGAGGKFNQGVVFELTPTAQGWTETVLYAFTGGTDGGVPAGGVIFDSVGNLYGTTQLGGLASCEGGSGCGTVFELTPANGNWSFNVLHTFSGPDGVSPYASMIFDTAGNLYGTTQTGSDNYGVVFKLSPSGNGWTETVLHGFEGKDGMYPYGGVILGPQGVVYGGAAYGGVGKILGYGVLFSIAP